MVSFLLKFAFARQVGRVIVCKWRLTCAFCHFAFIHRTASGNVEWFVAVEGGV